MVITPSRIPLTNLSGSITTGGVSQQVSAANNNRMYFFIQNISTKTLWINFGVAAVEDQPSIRLDPGASFVMEGSVVTADEINIIGGFTGSKFVSKEA